MPTKRVTSQGHLLIFRRGEGEVQGQRKDVHPKLGMPLNLALDFRPVRDQKATVKVSKADAEARKARANIHFEPPERVDFFLSFTPLALIFSLVLPPFLGVSIGHGGHLSLIVGCASIVRWRRSPHSSFINQSPGPGRIFQDT